MNNMQLARNCVDAVDRNRYISGTGSHISISLFTLVINSPQTLGLGYRSLILAIFLYDRSQLFVCFLYDNACVATRTGIFCTVL